MIKMDFDVMLEELGELGTFQKTVYILVCFPVLFAAANSLSYVFTAGVPDYRCLVPECDDPVFPAFHQEWLSWAIPQESSVTGENYMPSYCEKFVSNPTSENETCAVSTFATNVTIKCNEWVFSDERTIVNDWKITCLENQWMLSLVGTSHFAGIIVGSAMFGVLADRYGRKLIFIFCILLMSLSGVLQIVSPNYTFFVVFVFINALGTAGVYPLAFIIGIELVGKKKREITGIVLNYFYAVGEALVALIAWVVKDWMLLQVIVSAPPFLFIIYYWFVPESVRWLLAREKSSKAKRIVCQAAKVNNVVLSENLLDSFEDHSQIPSDCQNKTEGEVWPMMKLLLADKKFCVRFLIVYFIWAVNAFVYYGLSVNSVSMSGNKYLNFALVCLIEIPGYTLAWFCIDRFGRRISLVCFLFLCGITCSLTLIVPSNILWMETVLFLTGKLGITSAFGVVYVHTAEMLPTIVRSGGVGSASTTARVGALVAPFVPLLGVYVPALPMVLFGGVAIVACILALKLPETKGKKLPESIEEALSL